MKRIADLALARGPWVVAGFAFVSLVLGAGLLRLGLDSSIDAMYPDGSPVTALHRQVQQAFGSGKLLIAVLQGDIYTRQSLIDLDRLTSALERVKGVRRVTSAANARRMEDDQGLLRIEDLVDPQRLTAGDIASIRAFLRTSDLYGRGLLVNDAGTAAAVVMEIDDNADSRAVLKATRETIASAWPGPSHLAGSPLIEVEMGDTVRRELPLLAGLAAILIVAMLVLNFRTVQGAALPLLTVVIGALWSMGAMGWLGAKLTTLNIIGPVAILAVGSSFSLQLLGRFYYELERGSPKRDAAHVAVAETGLGVLISGVAIAAAMSTFVLSAMPTVRVLGLLTAGGVLAALLASLLLVPALMVRLPAPRRLPDPESPAIVGVNLHRLARFVAAHPRAILGVAGALAVVAVVGATRIVPNTALLSYFREGSAVRQSYELAERTFGGASQIQVLVTGDLDDPALLRAMLAFQNGIERIPGVAHSASIATVLRSINQTLTGEDGLPATRQAVAQELLVYQMSGDVADLTQFRTLDGRQGLIEITARSTPTRELHHVYDAIRQVGATTIGARASLGYTGASLLQLAIEHALLHDFAVSLTLAIALVILIDSLVRSIPAALVTIVALLLTIGLQYGALGYLGIPLDLATMLLGALAIGVGDYAIHLTVRYMEERRRGHAPEAAMERALATSGRSVLFTALTLGAGFAAMLSSTFVPIRMLGALMVFTVASIGIASLTLLPAACLVFLRNPRSPRSIRREVPKHV